jgi:chromosome condensin MukBEF ATPase and DNA-binding subunit MukB
MMSDAAKKMAIRMAMDYVIKGLEKLVVLLKAMDEDDVAKRVDEIKGQLTEAVKGKG